MGYHYAPPFSHLVKERGICMFKFFKRANIKQKIDCVIVGLGNPGEKYKNTRHNAGFIAIDHIIRERHIHSKKIKFSSEIYETTLENKRILLVKPQTYMNLSGDAIVQIINFHKIHIENFIIIVDDIALPVGKLRIKRKGSAGGHNGLKDIINKVGSDQITRVKIGVGAKPGKWNLADWVTSEFSATERQQIDIASQKVHKALSLIVENKIDEAMNKFNS